MSETNDAVSKDKKKWSKKKKIIVITAGILGFLLLAALCTGLGVLHWYCSVEDYNIVSSYNITDSSTRLIAHRGFRAKAPENTAPAFEHAGRSGYWGAECDVYRTEDGVWVTHHDSNTYRMMDCTRRIEKSTYKQLLKHNVDNGNNADNYPNLKICSLEKYLSICDEFEMTAVIELKGKNNTEHYDEIINMLDEHTCDAVFISFHEEALTAMRKLTSAQMFFLTQEISDEDIATAKKISNCGIDFNAGKEKNFENDAAIIKKCQESGLVLGAWTIDDLDTMKKCVDLGIKYITTDCITY